jgi:predicted nucleic acid-binding protein
MTRAAAPFALGAPVSLALAATADAQNTAAPAKPAPTAKPAKAPAKKPAAPQFKLVLEPPAMDLLKATSDNNLVPDAHRAALLGQPGVVTLYTDDRDFRKFEFLDLRDPLA